MSENNSEKDNNINDSDDNLTQSNDMYDAIARELNGDDSISGIQNLDDEMSGDEETEKLKLELTEAKDKYLRLVAEFENFRKRNAKERLEMSLTAGREVIQSMLTVMDDCDRAEKQMNTTSDIDLIKEGISLVFNKLRTTMQQKGLKAMEAQGEPFDADLHEAITEIPAPSEGMVGKIIDVIEPGYYLNDKLIRHAKVVVGK